MKKHLISMMLGLAGALSVTAATAPVYVNDAHGDRACASLDEAFELLAGEAEPILPDGVINVRICDGIAPLADISVDLSAKANLNRLVIEGGSYSGGHSSPRSDTIIRVQGLGLAEDQYEPTADGIRNIRANLPASGTLEVRNLHLSDCIQFDAGSVHDTTRTVYVHDCQIDKGWYVASPAAGTYRFEDNDFTSGFEGYAVWLYFQSQQTHDLAFDFERNRVQCYRVLNTSSSGNLVTNARTDIQMKDNTFVHTELTKEAYLQHRTGPCMGLCQVTGKANGNVVISGNKMLGYYHHDDAVPALLTIHRLGGASDDVSTWMTAGSTLSITNNDRQCDVVEVAYHGAMKDATALFTGVDGVTLENNRKVHLYPADTADHSSVCHICTACKDAVYRVEVKNGRIDSGVESLAVVPNYSGYGFEIGAKSTPNAFVLSVGKTNDVVCTGYEGELQSYVFEGLAVDMPFTDWPWPHTGNQYTLSAINNDAMWGVELVRCPVMKIAFRQLYVRSANFHASLKVEANTTNVLIAVPWTFYTPDGSPSSNLPVNRLVRPVNLSEGDMLLKVVDSKVYESWMLMPGNEAGSSLRWVAARTVSERAPVEAQAVSNRVSDVKPAEDKQIPRGSGLWLIRTEPKVDEDWKPFYLYGQWTKGGALVKVEGPASGETANTVMVAHPGCARDLAINGDIRWEGVDASDTLSLPNGTDAWFLCSWDAAKGQWYTSKAERVGRATRYTRDYDLTVPAGHGFWYVRRAASPVTIEFVDK